MLPAKYDVYAYRWSTVFGRHTAWIMVDAEGIIQASPQETSPTKDFEGKPLEEFQKARKEPDWRFKDDKLILARERDKEE